MVNTSIFPPMEQIPEKFRLRHRVVQKEYLINGRLVKWDGRLQEVYSPVCIKAENGSISPYLIGEYPMLKAKESLEALDSAVAAYDHGRGTWPTMSLEQRIAHLEKFTLRMKEHREEVINLLMWEIGKTLTDSAKEFDRTVEYIRDTIEALKELDRVSSRFQIHQGIIGQIRRAPLGVVLCMGPFNYPLNETFTTLIPALIMGNTVIFKPPKYGVLLHQPLLTAFRDSFPPGVINTVYGDGPEVIGPLMESGKIDVLAFIGTSRVAGILKKQHPSPHRLRSVLGLEAKNPAIVLPGADLDLAVSECILGSLSYNGQRCTALKIIFVHESIAEEFIRRMAEGISSLKIGMPWDEKVQITPLPEEGKTDYLARLVNDAVSKGAKVVNAGGGESHHTFFSPALLYPVNGSMKVWTEEQFGPVVPVAPFKDIAEPLEYVTNSNYGQQISIFGKESDTIAKLIDPLVNQVCRLNINSQCQRGPDTFPFTGRKDSAEGTLSVSDALRVFSIRSLVAAKSTDQNKQIITTIVKEDKSNFLSTDFIF
ncbi:MAG: NADP-dependent glyceraldehyde-3-phosphate dehydrogenase [Bacteroidales bacterium]|nr:NADP-dependent glyceraldehyde-3-phosphate dehydrogenase [Bacteroidales bacterium]